MFIPRYLTPLRPPTQLSTGAGDDKAIQKAARFVSLIPYVEDTALFNDLPDLTSTS